MNHKMPLQFQPQPPLLPKTTGGKRGPSAPISIPSLVNDEDESDQSITDHSPPSQNKILPLDLPPTVNKQNNFILLTTTKSPRGHTGSKKVIPFTASPRALNNNNSGTLNLNHSSSSHAYAPTSFIILNNNNNNNGTTFTSFNPVSNVNISNTPCENSAKNATASSNSIPPIQPGISTNNQQNLNNTCSDSTCSAVTNSNEIPVVVQVADSCVSPSAKENVPDSLPDGSNSPSASFAYEHDHDYENIASPASSTSSGPIYVRPPGFKHHAQEIIAPSLRNNLKKKKNYATLNTLREGFKKREPTPPKLKPKREPLPMKLRALPQSFWQQPNVAHQVSPSTLFPVLPPLPSRETEDTLMEIRPVTPPDENLKKPHPAPERKINVTNTDLLLKLFEGIGEDKGKSQSVSKTRTQHKKQQHMDRKQQHMDRKQQHMDRKQQHIDPKQQHMDTKQQHMDRKHTTYGQKTTPYGQKTTTYMDTKQQHMDYKTTTYGHKTYNIWTENNNIWTENNNIWTQNNIQTEVLHFQLLPQIRSSD
ncbi:hypothetical protein Btru_018210 [Bulinus truncatus]|nr:hypothetical protein Btru_018210 [Bulinus truncatus]